MSPFSSRPVPELLARAQWMRELATELLGDPAAAEDVVQEASLAALRHPPLADRPVEPWLARVVRNLAWKRRRSEARRVVHERAAARREPVAGPEATLERLELERQLLAAVEAVAEPFRTAVVERYFQGRSSAEVARALGVPEGTVRWRLKRGLEELRSRLDSAYGERGAWAALLTPWVAQSSAPGPSGVAPVSLARLGFDGGVLAMVGASKWILAAAVTAAVIGVVIWRQAEEERRVSVSPVAQAATEPAAAPAAAFPLVPAPQAPRQEVPVEVPSQPSHAAVAPVALEEAELATHAWLDVRFVDEFGAPWSDVAVARLFDGLVYGRSDEEGRAAIRLEPDDDAQEWTAVLVARRAGCAQRELRAVVVAGRRTQLGDVLLSKGARLVGLVVDEGGVPIEGAEVGLATPELFPEEEWAAPKDEAFVRRAGSPAFERSILTKSAADGRFVFDGAPEGTWRLWGRANGRRFGWTEPFEVVARRDVSEIVVVVPAYEPADLVGGIVLDPSGEPLPFAGLTWTYSTEFESSTSQRKAGADGRFEFVIRHVASYTLVASDPEQRYTAAVVTDVQPGARDVELRLSAPRTLDVLVTDHQGTELDGCQFSLGERFGALYSEKAPAVERLELGRYRLTIPGGTFDLRAEAEGFLPTRLEGLQPLSIGPSLELVLERAPRLEGRVMVDGKPVAGARVTLHRAVIDRGYWWNDFACVYEHSAEREATSDANGRFALSTRGTEPVWLRASAHGWVDGEAGPLQPLAEQEVRIELSAGGSLEGRVLLPDGASPEGVVVGINHGDARARTLRVGPSGEFRFDHLVPGSWHVSRRDQELDPSSTSSATSSSPVEFRWSCTVLPGRTTVFDLDLTRP